MLSKVYGAGLFGIQGVLVCCESDIGNGLPGISIIGYLSSEVRESVDRVRTAIKNAGIKLEPRKVIVNLSPADLRKDGSGYDLPIAISILASYGLIEPTMTKDSVFLGELSLGGELLPIRGCLSIVMAAKESGFRRIFVPKENYPEAKVMDGIDCLAVGSLREVIALLNGETCPDDWQKQQEKWAKTIPYAEKKPEMELDFSEILGQDGVKRATIIAVAGRHNLMIIGPAGTGKSMIAQRIPGIMPMLTKREALDVTRIHSICGILDEHHALVSKRPFRSPHHTISMQALCGGGVRPKPGEISMATHGVLFLDEFAEFKRETLEVLRQPMEDRIMRISRLHGAYEFPADFMLVCATNPCKCGFYPDKSRCFCSESDVKKYIGKISKPILDRIDICVESGNIEYATLKAATQNLATKQTAYDAHCSKEIRKRVEKARVIQERRFFGSSILFNAQMDPARIEQFCKLPKEEEDLLQHFYEKKGMSLRSLHKVLKVARTIADLEECEQIAKAHLAEALHYRSLEERYWGKSDANS